MVSTLRCDLAAGAGCWLMLMLLVLFGSLCCQAQDLLRNQQKQAPQQANQLANIQLPPELASLTPAQLHQLAQLREMQIQQQQQQQQQSQNNQAPPTPIGADSLPTTQPASVSSAQIPQPNLATQPATSADSNERHDDGAYNESGSEMEGIIQPDGASSGPQTQSAAAASNQQAAQTGSANAQAQAAAPTFEVNWNKCPQLEPSESEKSKKTQVITKCLQSAPIPSNLTRENVENHREQIATCALRVEGWFDEQGNYRYDKAESEIRGKKLESNIELQVLKFHVACKDEASKKFPREQNKLIDQVQFYQACMDYYISIVCEIEVSVDQ